MDGGDVGFELCDVAIVNVSEICGDECVELVSIYGQTGCTEGRQRQDACGTAGQVEKKFLQR